MKTLKVLILSDTKPGHVSQSQGLLHYLGEHFQVKSTELQVKPKIKIANHFFKKLLNSKSIYAERFFRWFYRFNLPQVLSCTPDLIISTGGDTCGANAFLAKKYRCKNLFLGSLRGHDPALFSALVSTTPMPGVDNCIVLDVAPSLINIQGLKDAASGFLKIKKIATDKPLWVMLIGGNGSGYQFSKADYETLSHAMISLARKHDIRWLITTSRRTGLADEQFLQTLLNDKKEIAYAVYFNEQPKKIMQAYLGAGQRIFCTEDSTSMVSEAVVSQKPVITLRSQTIDINSGHESVIRRFANQHFIQRLTIDKLAVFSDVDFNYKKIEPEKHYDRIIRVISE